jgi:hypothetical protein
MKKNKLCKAVQNAFDLDDKLSAAIQKVESLLVFKGFDIEPQASMCHGGEFILEYLGGEIFIELAIELMETKGFIEPSDFL